MFLIANFEEAENRNKVQIPSQKYQEAERQFVKLLEVEELDKYVEEDPAIASKFENALSEAMVSAYEENTGDEAAHRFLMRVLYRINRLKLFWYDDLGRYANEQSVYLHKIRNQIEKAWQQWEVARLDVAALRNIEIASALKQRVAADLNPAPSVNGQFFRERMSEVGYRRLVAIASLDGLVEASQLSRTLGGVGNQIQSVLMRLLMEEYGGGRQERKHSSYFTEMLVALGMQTQPEAYFDLVPWEVLASINQSFLLSENKRHFLQYIGGLLYFEVSVPAAFCNYQAAAIRLGLPPSATSYWNIHIKADIQHGRWMIEDVALPLAKLYPTDAWELVLGYDRQKLISDRAGAAVARSARQAEQTAALVFKKDKWKSTPR